MLWRAKWITYQLKKQPKSGKSRNGEFKSCVRMEELTVLNDSADRGWYPGILKNQMIYEGVAPNKKGGDIHV